MNLFKDYNYIIIVMPQKKKGNNNNRRTKKKLDLIYADSIINQEYGYVEKSFGNCHFKVININGEDRIASLSGLMKKRCYVRDNDLVLLEPMADSNNCKYQIIFRYTQEQKKILEKEGRLKKVEEEVEENNEMFQFEEEISVKQNETLDVNESFIDDI